MNSSPPPLSPYNSSPFFPSLSSSLHSTPTSPRASLPPLDQHWQHQLHTHSPETSIVGNEELLVEDELLLDSPQFGSRQNSIFSTSRSFVRDRNTWLTPRNGYTELTDNENLLNKDLQVKIETELAYYSQQHADRQRQQLTDTLRRPMETDVKESYTERFEEAIHVKEEEMSSALPPQQQPASRRHSLRQTPQKREPFDPSHSTTSNTSSTTNATTSNNTSSRSRRSNRTTTSSTVLTAATAATAAAISLNRPLTRTERNNLAALKYRAKKKADYQRMTVELEQKDAEISKLNQENQILKTQLEYLKSKVELANAAIQQHTQHSNNVNEVENDTNASTCDIGNSNPSTSPLSTELQQSAASAVMTLLSAFLLYNPQLLQQTPSLQLTPQQLRELQQSAYLPLVKLYGQTAVSAALQSVAFNLLQTTQVKIIQQTI